MDAYAGPMGIEDEIRKARRVRPALERARFAIGHLEPLAQEFFRQVYAVRNAAVLEASRSGNSYREIAEEIGYSKAQVQNMIAAAKADEAALSAIIDDA